MVITDLEDPQRVQGLAHKATRAAIAADAGMVTGSRVGPVGLGGLG
jgi:hypothetical protein